jgi:predicted kinase
MIRAIIVDMDGTLANVKHRLHYLSRLPKGMSSFETYHGLIDQPKDWTSFHDACVDDTPIEAVAWLVTALFATTSLSSGKYAIVIVSARHEPYRERTEAWLAKFGIPHDRLYMRTDEDTRPDHEIKADILAQMMDDGYEPWLAIDDRPEVCDMWESFGIAVLRCSYEDVQAKYAGKVMVTLLVGPSGAGKSTYAKKHFKPGEIIETDAIREAEGLGHDPDALALTFKLARGYAKARLDAGLPVVIDATNLRKKDRAHFTRLVPTGALIKYVLIDRNYEDKVETKGDRLADIVDRHHRYFRDTTMKDMKLADGLGNVIVEDKRIGRR